MLYYLLAFVLLLCFINILFNYNAKARLLRNIPGPEFKFIFGNGLDVRCSTVEAMNMARKFARLWDGIYRIYAFPFGAVIIYNPEDVEIVTSNMKNIDKSILYNLLKPWLGDGLLISYGSKWNQRRKILTPTFHFNILRGFYEVFVENSQRMVARLKQTDGLPIDIVPILSELTLNIICETAMGTRLSEDVSVAGRSYKESIYQLGHCIVQRFVNICLHSNFIFKLTSLARKQNKVLEIVHGFTEKVIKDRKEYLEKNNLIKSDNMDDDTYSNKKKRKTAMLDLLISAEKEGLIDKVGVQEEVDTFMFAGQDTTAAGLTFCFMLLANHTKVQDKIVDELREIFEDWDRPIKMEDLSKMKYLDCCIKESMRLYPPIHFISRNLNETVVLSNHTVPAGTMCCISIYDLHRRADLFPNPEQFDPDRFLPENCAGRHPYAYIPFSAGPRNCIGQKFAMMEMKVVVAEVLRQFKLVPVTRPEDIQIIPDLVLRNDEPVRVKFIRRQSG